MKSNSLSISPMSVSVIRDVEMTEDIKGNGFPDFDLPTLQVAFESGDAKSVAGLLNRKDASVNELDDSGLSILHRASKSGNTEMIRHLIISQPKFDINVLSKDGSTALHLAVKHKKKACVELLLSNGAELDILDGSGKAPLHIAARTASKDLLQVFLKHSKVNINIDSKAKATPLHYAVSNGSHEACEVLINAGANVYKSDIGNQTPLIIAATEKHSDVLQLIIDSARKLSTLFHGYLHHRDHEGATALHLAVLNNHYDNVKLLLEAGAKINDPKGVFASNGHASSDDHSTALHIAAIFGFHEVASLLINNGATVDCRTRTKQTPLHKAAMFDSHTVCADILISNGADVNATDSHHKQPLHYAVEKAHLGMIRYLISHGAGHGEVDDHGRSLVHFSVESTSMECLNLLLELLPKETITKAVNKNDVKEMTPLHYCAKNGHLEILNKVLELGGSAGSKDDFDRTPLHLAAEYGNSQCVEALFKHSKAEVNDDDTEGNTPMLLACQNGHYNCVKTLLGFGADVTAKGHDEENHSAVTLSASQGHLELIDLLLDSGADVNTITKYRDTPLHLACKNNHIGVVNLLLGRCADVRARNFSNQTPLDTAIESRAAESAAAIIKSERWEETLSCVDEVGNNPFPRLVAFMPSVAELVLDNCVKRAGDPESKEFTVTYNLKYIDPHPMSLACKDSKAWYANDMSEHGCENLLAHEVTEASIYSKWMTFGQFAFTIDAIYYSAVVVILSAFIIAIPNYTTDYVDKNLCPMLITEEEANNKTLFDALHENGTLDRFEKPTEKLMRTARGLWIASVIAILGITIRLLSSFLFLRLLFFKRFNTYGTTIMLLCVGTGIGMVDINTLVLCSFQWRAVWLGILVSWSLLTEYIIRLPVVGVYVAMFLKVCASVIKTLLVLMMFFVAFAGCFYITLNRRPEFSNPLLAYLSVFNMGLGEINFVDRFVISNTGPLYYDNLILASIFMVVIPIALINLLIGVAVGDIDAVRSDSNLRLISLRIKTIDEYQRYALQYFQKRWYKESVTVYPNGTSHGCIYRLIKYLAQLGKRSVYQRSKGWEYHSRLQPVVDTVEMLTTELEGTKLRLAKMQQTINQQNELLLAIAGKVGAKLDHRGKYVS